MDFPLITKKDNLEHLMITSHHIPYDEGIKIMSHRYNFDRINEIMKAFLDAARDAGDINVTVLDQVTYHVDKFYYVSQIRRSVIGINTITNEKIIETTIHLSNDIFLYTPKEKLKQIPMIDIHHNSYDFSVLAKEELDKFPIIFEFATKYLHHPQIQSELKRRVFYSFVDNRIDFEFINIPANCSLRINFEPGLPYGGKDIDDYWDEF